MIDLEPLLALQARDLSLDRLRHRHGTLPERAVVAAGESRAEALATEVVRVRGERDAVADDERRLEAEATSLAGQASAAEAKLYSGEISSPRELQALQADVEQLRRHQRDVEDRQITVMERREPLDARLAELEAEAEIVMQDLATARAALAEAVDAVDSEIAVETGARAEIAAAILPDLVSVYERCREKAKGIGAARLVAGTCQGCHLSIPATEVDRLRRHADDEIGHCDNCGCILVLST
ncbi:MAG TPA: C4-type zinc ribbon domain-containing protein [Acidimicrobiia bacterium]|nr:C4-type zinc ribbon domain-containing protein [Acidimicrobiia bacterium]